MVRDGPLRLNNKVVLLVISISSILTACTRSAPDLPSASVETVSLTPQERKLTCQQVAKQQRNIRAEEKKLEDIISGNRSYNQATGYVSSVLFPPAAAILAEQNMAEKEKLDKLQKLRDRLVLVSRKKSC